MRNVMFLLETGKPLAGQGRCQAPVQRFNSKPIIALKMKLPKGFYRFLKLSKGFFNAALDGR
jgi:hypothetical protein